MIPTVSVLMPVYNGMPYLPEAVESILQQTFTDFEFIIVNDHSTDSTLDYLKSLGDPRIVRIDLPVNSGVTAALQAGLKAARGEFIARLDAGDIAYPERLAKQVAFMQKNNQVGLLASFADNIALDGSLLPVGKRVSKSDIDIRWDLLFKNPLIHSTVMFRTGVAADAGLGYRLPHAEDYDLWTALAQVTEVALLPDPLIKYRINPKSWTYIKADEQNLGGIAVSDREMLRLVNTSPESREEIRKLIRSGGYLSSHDRSVFVELINAFLRQHSRLMTKRFARRLQRLLLSRLGWYALLEGIYWRLFLLKRPY